MGGVFLILLVGFVFMIATALPRVLSWFELGRVAANEPLTIEKTEVISYSLERPQLSRSGSCESRSLLVPRTNAWRCSVRNEVYDPCFAVGDPVTVVCGVDPRAQIHGFRLDLATALPDASLSATRTITPTKIAPAAFSSMEYTLDLIGKPVRLVNGQYYAQSQTQGGVAVLVALSEMQANGDLDLDGDEDTAVLLVADVGGSGMFVYLAVVLNENGNPFNSATISLGDRVKVDDMDIRNGQIMVNMTTHGVNDPACCPTLQVTHFYNLLGSRLVQWTDGWRLELADGVACAPAVQETAGQRLPAYRCSDGRWLQQTLRPGEVWFAEPAQASQAPDGESPDLVPISRLWQ